ncbi:MAG: hypothetical protein KA807_09680 [Prolixibacteraceae bacterium]|nr:hypothetical protein [Prolixibacteraceae bacterium]
MKNYLYLIFVLLLYSKLSFSQSYQLSTKLDSAGYYFDCYDFETSESLYQSILHSDSLNFAALNGLADSKINLGKKIEALSILDKLMFLDTTNRTSGKKASVLMDLSRFKEAEAIYSNLCLLDSINAYFSRKLAISVYKQDEFFRSIPFIKNYLKLQSSDLEMKMVLAESYFKIDSFPKSLAICEEILQEDSMYSSAVSRAGFICFTKLKDYEKALPFYERLNFLEKFKDPFHLKNLGICEFFTGRPEHAAQLLDSLSDQINDDAMIPFYAGLSYKRLGKVDEALIFLERAAVVAVPSYVADVYHHLGRTYSQKRMFEEALEAYFKVREIDLSNYLVLFDIAIAYEESKRDIMAALPYYELYIKKTTNTNSVDYEYAKNRVEKIKEQLFFEGK